MIMNLLDRMKFPFRKNKEFLTVLYDILGFYPHNLEVYRVAFAHKSLSYHRDEAAGKKDSRGNNRRQRSETTSKPLNNERLEYLGDAVLESIVSDILFRHFPNKREGFLTSTRSKMVQRDTLNKLAIALGLEKLIQAAQGTDMNHTNIAGNAFEALMGAIYLDRGYKHCHWFISNRVVGRHIDIDALAHKEVNFKSKLLEWSQKNRIRLDFKDLHQTTDKDGAHVFHTMVVIEGLECGRGRGYSKKESQQSAAQESLIILKKHKGFQDSVFEAKSKRTAMEEQPEALLPEIPDEVLTANPKEKGQARKKEEKPAEGKKEETKATPRRRRPAPEKKPIEQITESEKPVEETPIPEKPVENIPQTESPDSEDSVSETTDGAQPVKKKPRRRGSRRKETSLGDH